MNILTKNGHQCNALAGLIYLYADTIEVYFLRYRWTDEAAHRLKSIGCVIYKCHDKNGKLWGYRVGVNYPIARKQIKRFEQIRQRYGGIIGRVDPAWDIQPNAVVSKRQIYNFLRCTTTIKW